LIDGEAQCEELIHTIGRVESELIEERGGFVTDELSIRQTAEHLNAKLPPFSSGEIRSVTRTFKYVAVEERFRVFDEDRLSVRLVVATVLAIAEDHQIALVEVGCSQIARGALNPITQGGELDHGRGNRERPAA
jgi:hypothetical protein